MSWVDDMTRYQLCVEDVGEGFLDACFDIDGRWLNGHGPGSGCPNCNPPKRLWCERNESSASAHAHTAECYR